MTVARQTKRYLEKLIGLAIALAIFGLLVIGAYAVVTGAIL